MPVDTAQGVALVFYRWAVVLDDRPYRVARQRRIEKVKHVQTVTKHVPAYAAPWQEVVCYGTQAIVDILTIKTGNVPILTYIEEKCDIPESV